MSAKMEFPPYEDARRIVIENGIKDSRKYWSICKELGLPTHPEKYYSGKGWSGWSAFFGEEKKPFPSFEDAKKTVIENGIKGVNEYKARFKELGLPSKPSVYYKNAGWAGWEDFCDKVNEEFPSYEEAHRAVMENGIQSPREYLARYKEFGLPSAPNLYYKDKGWIDWPSFFGRESKSFPSYEDAHRAVMENGIDCKEKYKSRYKELGLPSAPNGTYKGKGWIDWPSFFGKPHIVSHRERKAKVLSKLSLNPILLDDKAPLQVIYMVASCVDKELAKEIETLLDSSSSEDRLNWVKEQLKDVKEETKVGPETTSASLDEASAMESMMEVFEDTFEDLSDEDTANINTILENYYHNVVNKELIAEYDG